VLQSKHLLHISERFTMKELNVREMRAANRRAGRTLFDWRYVSAEGGPVAVTAGFTIPTERLSEREAADLLMLVAGFRIREQATPGLIARLRRIAPRLRGIEIGGRLAVIFSGEDLSAGLVGNPVDGINGYAPLAAKGSDGKLRAGASEIMSNILLYAAKRAPGGVTSVKPPASKPPPRSRK
jgi:hypothetical protein